MEKFEIHISKIFNLESKANEPKQTIIITKEQLMVVELFADTRKDEDLNTTYKLNQCEFKVIPHINLGHEE